MITHEFLIYQPIITQRVQHINLYMSRRHTSKLNVLWILQIHAAIEKQRRSPGLSWELPLQVYKGKETNQMVCLIYTKPGTGGKCIPAENPGQESGNRTFILLYSGLRSAQPQQGSEPCKGVSGAVNTPAGRSKVGEHAGLGGSRLDSTTVEKPRISETM
jgi:hypothetical protein